MRCKRDRAVSVPMPKLSVDATVSERNGQRKSQYSLFPEHGETLSIVARNMAVHIEVIDHGKSCITVEVQATRTGSLLYDGHTVCIHEGDAPTPFLFSYPRRAETAEESVCVELSVVGGIFSEDE